MVRISKLHRKLFRDIAASKVQFGAVIFIILLGVTMFVGAYGAYQNLGNSYETSFKKLGMADYWVTVDYIDQNAARDLNSISGVTAEGRIIGDVNIDLVEESGEKVVGRVVSLPPHEHPVLNNVQVVSGSYFTAGSRREILVEKHLADYHKFKPGDWLTIERDGSRAHFKIVGIVTSPEYIWVAKSAQEPMPTARTFGILFMPLPVVEDIFSMKGLFNELTIATVPSIDRNTMVNDIKQVLRKYKINRLTSRDDTVAIHTRKIDVIRGVRSAYLTERKDQISNRLLKQDLDGFASIAFLFPVLFLSMASLTIYVLLNRLIESQRIQIGLMRAIGYGKRTILFHYLEYALMLGLAGSILGVIVGYLMSNGLTDVYAAQLNIPFTIVEIQWGTIFIGFFIGVIIPLLAGFLPAWSTMRMRPAEAMRPATPSTGRKSIPELVLPFLKYLPYVIKLPLRNVFRNVRRSLFMATGVASAVVLIMVSMSFVDAMQKSLNTQFDVIQHYDARAIFQGTAAVTTASYIKNIDGVADTEAILEIPYRIQYGEESIDTSVMGLPPGSTMYKLISPDGSPVDVVSGGILVPSSFQDKLGIKAGDTVKLEPLVGTVGETEKQIAGIVDTYIGGQIYMPLKDAQKMTRQPGAATSVLLTFDGTPSFMLLKKLYNIPQIASIEFADDVKKMIDEMMGFFWVFIGVMLAMGAALGAAIIFNGVTVNVLQRTREIAIMRAVGTGNRMLAAMLTLENLAIGLIGILIGIPAGRYISEYFFKSMSTSTEDVVSMTLTIFPRTYLIAVIAALVILVISQLPAIRQVTHLSLATATKDWSE
jgi:putative ABC transport system permease protein